MTDPYVIKAVREICKTSDLPPDELLDELPKVIAQLRADSPAKRRFLTYIQRHNPEITFCWDTEQQTVCLTRHRPTATPVKTAIVRQRGRNTAGQRMVRIVCPTCDHRHWLPADQPITSCPRRPKSPRYTIANNQRGTPK